MDMLLSAGTAVAAGYALDLALGDPEWLPHPVVAFGAAIAWCDRNLNGGGERARFWMGLFAAVGLIAAAFALAWAAERLAGCAGPWARWAVVTVGIFFGLANRTLIREGRAVFGALEREGLARARLRLSRIVGRDTDGLDEREIRVAVLETMAENLNDGVVAPLFFCAIGGMPGMMAYKMANTLDSMIGHHGGRHEWFGKAAARIDDAANFIPARITAALMVLVCASGRGGRFVRRYAKAHASPNSGYPEAALAGILDLRFGGPRRYGGEIVAAPWIGENARPIGTGEIGKVVRINHAVCLASVGMAAACAAWLPRP